MNDNLIYYNNELCFFNEKENKLIYPYFELDLKYKLKDEMDEILFHSELMDYKVDNDNLKRDFKFTLYVSNQNREIITKKIYQLKADFDKKFHPITLNLNYNRVSIKIMHEGIISDVKYFYVSFYNLLHDKKAFHELKEKIYDFNSK